MLSSVQCLFEAHIVPHLPRFSYIPEGYLHVAHFRKYYMQQSGLDVTPVTQEPYWFACEMQIGRGAIEAVGAKVSLISWP